MRLAFWTTREFLRLAFVSLFRRGMIPPRHRKSLLFCLTSFVLFSLAAPLHAICMLLDNFLFPGYRKVAVRAPIFVIGNTRSGTTILHRVMAEDEEQFFCFRTWEILCPSVLEKKIASLVGQLDRWLGGRLKSFIERVEAERFAQFNRLHRIGFFLPEEDDKLLLYVLASADLVFFFPYAGFERMARLDVALDAAAQRRIMDFYAGCVRRQAYFKGGGRTLLSKNPWFTGKVENLLRLFPDCKIIYLVRNPLDVVPSSISVARAIIRSTAGGESEADLDEQAYEMIRFYYAYPLERLASLPDDRFLIVRYEDLVRQPKQVVLEIYERLGLSLTSAFEKRLDEEAAVMRNYQSSHRYSLDSCTVSREQILSDLGPIFARFDFDTR